MRKRFGALFLGFLFGFLVVLVRLFFWQITSFDVLKGLAEKQTLATVTVASKRGRIYATDGSPLVINEKAYLVFAEPKNLKNKEKVAPILAEKLAIPISTISAKLSSSLQWVPLANKISEKDMAALKEIGEGGLGFMEEPKRFYPEASMAAHLLGFVGRDAKGQDTGYFGIEGFYDEQLKGRSGMIRQEEDAFGRPILSAELDIVAAENGRDLILTIDKTVQYVLEHNLKTAIEKYGAKGGSAIMMEPSTGAILGLASYPSYDPSDVEKYPTEYFKNPTIASTYEPGSTFKVLVIAAALNENKLKPDATYDEDGPIQIADYTINTWNQKYHGKISLSQILEYSSNVGMVFVQKEMGADTLFTYVNKLGFGNPTDVDLQEEVSVALRPKNKWTTIDYATASFGQGIAVTPLQMVRAVASIANGGKLVKPYIVKSIRSPQGKRIEVNPTIITTVFKKEVTTLVAEMMATAVQNGETRYLQSTGLHVAGKTGTAQIPISGHYDTEKTIASFVGFAPVTNPKFVMLITIDEPTTSPWGSETAAPTFFAIAKELFPYFHISPTD